MAETRMGLLVAGFNYAGVNEDEFNDWYDTEHVPERERTPGFINCERWIGADDPKVSIATYDLESLNVTPERRLSQDRGRQSLAVVKAHDGEVAAYLPLRSGADAARQSECACQGARIASGRDERVAGSGARLQCVV